MEIVRIVAAVAAVAVIATTILSAVHTFVLPRPAVVRLSRAVFLGVRQVIVRLARLRRSPTRTDDMLALFAPISLLLLPVVWLIVIGGGYATVFWAVEQQGWRHAVTASGSSMFTLGFVRPHGLDGAFIAFSEAAIGLFLVALLITYLPSMYAAFSRREAQVALLESRAGQPPWAITMLVRFHLIDAFDHLDSLWIAWETWFVDVEESHLSLAALPFYRSPLPGRSWITAAGTVLDGAALFEAAIDRPKSARAQLCIRTGYLALRRIADFFGIAYDPDPAPTDATSISRQDFDDALDQLAAVGAPLVRDRDQAWLEFNGWRVNYDSALLGLAALTLAPHAPWSSDRMAPYRRPPVGRRARNRAASRPPTP